MLVVVVVGAKVGDVGLRHLVQQRAQRKGGGDLGPAVHGGAAGRMEGGQEQRCGRRRRDLGSPAEQHSRAFMMPP